MVRGSQLQSVGTRRRVLVVEDEADLARVIKRHVEDIGYQVRIEPTGEDALEAAAATAFDLVLLDVMLPGIDGLEVCRRLRARQQYMPVLMLTARSSEIDKVLGLETGADDYLTKPFSMEELLLRINAVLRRTRNEEPEEGRETTFTLGTFTFDARKQILQGPTGTRNLTTKETQLLQLLSEHANKVLERSMALQAVWGDDNYFNGRSMDVYIAKLRKYLAEDPGVAIVNVHGKGFRLVLQEG